MTLKPTRTEKWMRIGFYSLIGYTAVSTSLAWMTDWGVIQPSHSATQAEEKPQSETTFQDQLSAQTFATNFVREYFLWTKDQPESRENRLAPYLHPEMDQQAGLDLKSVKWDSWAREVEPWSVQTGEEKNQLEATIYAQLNMSQGKKEKRVDRWVKVFMEKAGDSYVVTAPPQFIAPPDADVPDKEEEDSEEKTGDSTGDSVDSKVQDDIESYLQSFWETYTTSEPEEIRYLFQDDDPRPGLTGILYFQEMKSLEVKKKGSTYIAECQVNFQDLSSQANVTLPYTLYLTREGTRWYVVDMTQTQQP